MKHKYFFDDVNELTSQTWHFELTKVYGFCVRNSPPSLQLQGLKRLLLKVAISQRNPPPRPGTVCGFDPITGGESCRLPGRLLGSSSWLAADVGPHAARLPRRTSDQAWLGSNLDPDKIIALERRVLSQDAELVLRVRLFAWQSCRAVGNLRQMNARSSVSSDDP